MAAPACGHWDAGDAQPGLRQLRWRAERRHPWSWSDFQARSKETSAEQREALFDLYMRRHDRIDSWDLVDRSAINVIGGYLADKPRDVLYELADSERMAERRTAIVSTAYFMMKQGNLDDMFAIAGLLLGDGNELVQKAVGWMLPVAGDRLLGFLGDHAGHIQAAR